MLNIYLFMFASFIYLFMKKDIYIYNKALSYTLSSSPTNEQKDSLKHILNAFYKYGDGDVNKLNYIIATAIHESNLKPIKEYRAKKYTPLYTQQNKYWLTGYYGRGFVQLTWLSNYKKYEDFLNIPLVKQPDLALNPAYASEILVHGMINGVFTGKKLSDYINHKQTDFINARRVVNGTDKAQLIANITKKLSNKTF